MACEEERMKKNIITCSAEIVATEGERVREIPKILTGKRSEREKIKNEMKRVFF